MIPTVDVTAAVLARLRAVDTAHEVYDQAAGPGAADEQRYTVLRSIPAPPPDPESAGSMDDPDANAMRRYRLTHVGRGDVGRELAERAADMLRPAMLNRANPLTGTGWQVRGHYFEGSLGAEEEGPVTNVHEDFLLWVVATA